MDRAVVSNHAIKQFALCRFGHEQLHHKRSYYEKLIRVYFEDAKPYQLPKHIQVSKKLKYGNETDTTYHVNWVEKILFTVIGEKIVTVFFPYSGSKRQKSMYKKQ